MSNRYVVVGAGAVGATLAAELHRAGREVVLVARGEHLAVLRRQGLRYRTPTEDVLVPLPAIGDPEEVGLGPADVLVLATKTQDVEAAVARWAPQRRACDCSSSAAPSSSAGTWCRRHSPAATRSPPSPAA